MGKHIKIKLQVQIFKEGDYYIAFSPDLQIATHANSFEQAKLRFEERLQIFLERAEETGTLEKRLRKLGWTTSKRKKPMPPAEVKVPREILNAQPRETYEREIVA